MYLFFEAIFFSFSLRLYQVGADQRFEIKFKGKHIFCYIIAYYDQHRTVNASGVNVQKGIKRWGIKTDFQLFFLIFIFRILKIAKLTLQINRPICYKIFKTRIQDLFQQSYDVKSSYCDVITHE